MLPRAVYMFPGQGTQLVGMGKSLQRSAAARAVFEEVDAYLAEPLSRTLFEGPLSALSQTRLTQPAIFAHSVASLQALLEANAAGLLRQPLPAAPSLYLGHSVGEYAALAVGGSLGVGQAARLLRLRGEAMQRAGDEAAAAAASGGATGMTALLLGAPAPSLAALALAITQACQLASTPTATASLAALNSPSQAVLSGHVGAMALAVAALQQRAPELRLRRAMALPVSAPFHSPIMAPAALALQEALSQLSPPMQPLAAPLLCGWSAQPCTSVAELQQALVQGVTSTVQWGPCVQQALGSSTGQRTHFLEFGPRGGTLGALVKQCDAAHALPGRADTSSVEVWEDIESRKHALC
jgi:[acyl-carrier-protein] S-malonyltransferase